MIGVRQGIGRLRRTPSSTSDRSISERHRSVTRLSVRHKFHVYDLEMNYMVGANQETKIRFYMVPLGVYFKTRRRTQTREAVLRVYAMDALQIFREVLPARAVS